MTSCSVCVVQKEKHDYSNCCFMLYSIGVGYTFSKKFYDVGLTGEVKNVLSVI